MVNPDDWPRIGTLKVDPRLLEVRSVGRCRLEECRAACCGHGVYVDLAHAGSLVDQAELIKPHLPPDRRDVDRWFDGRVEQDNDVPSGHRVGTDVVLDPSHPAGTRCVFLRPDNLCALQVASVAQGRHPWDLKPFFCALYPIVLMGGTLELDDKNELYGLGGTCQRAEATPMPLYQLFQVELTLALGPDGYQQLCALATTPSPTTPAPGVST